jgi:hypothetical protein
MKKIILTVFLAGFLAAGSGAAQAADDFQYWSRYLFNVASKGNFNYMLYGEARLRNDAERLEIFLLSPQVQWKFSKNLNLQFNYTYIGSRGATRDDFAVQHRAEFEVNPHWSVGGWLKIQNRNRMEFRWIEDNGPDNPRLRNRLRFLFPLKGIGPLTSLFADTEWFYNFDQDKHDEQRTIPVGLNFKVNDLVNFQTFYMIQHTKTDTWKSNQILGTMFTVKF